LISEVIEQFAVDEAKAATDLLSQAALGGVLKELCLVARNMALAMEKRSKESVFYNSLASIQAK